MICLSPGNGPASRSAADGPSAPIAKHRPRLRAAALTPHARARTPRAGSLTPHPGTYGALLTMELLMFYLPNHLGL